MDHNPDASASQSRAAPRDPPRLRSEPALRALAGFITGSIPEVDEAAFVVRVGPSSSPEHDPGGFRVLGVGDHILSTAELQVRMADGPVFDSLRDGRIHLLDTGVDATAAPEVATLARELGTEGLGAVPIFVGEEPVAVLTLASTRGGAFSGPVLQRAVRLSEVAATVIGTDASFRNEIEHLEHAMQSRAVIEQAKGMLILMEGCTADAAFDQLRERSQRENRKLRLVAEDVVAERSDAMVWFADHIERIARVAYLASATADLHEVITVVVQEGLAGLDADGGVVAIVDGRGVLVPAYVDGYSPEAVLAFHPISMEGPEVPLTAAVNACEPVWVRDRTEAAARFPGFLDRVRSGSQAWAAVPLLHAGFAVGVVGLSFETAQRFTEPEQLYIRALGEICATVLWDRAADPSRESPDVLVLRDVSARTAAVTTLLEGVLEGVLDGGQLSDTSARDVEDAVTELHGILDDVRAAELRRLRSVDLFPLAALLASTREMIVLTDAGHRIVYASPHLVPMLGRHPDDHCGLPVVELVHPDDRERVEAVFRDLAGRPGGESSFRCRLQHRNGSWVPVEVHQAHRLDDPALAGYVGTIRVIDGDALADDPAARPVS